MPTIPPKLLEAAAPYELGKPPQFQLGTLYPVYIRSPAQLTARNVSAAATEFQRIIDHRGIVLNFPLGAVSSATRSCLCNVRRHRQSPHRVSGFLRPLERRRPRHPHPERSQGGVREAAIAGKTA